MVIPDNLHYYQGIIVSEVAMTLLLFVAFQIAFYAIWGYQSSQAKLQEKKKEGTQQQEQPRFGKWDQKTWNIYFPIIFANHIIALAMPMVYSPYIFTIIIAYLHFVLFIALIVVNIVVKEAEPGQGMRTIVSRIIWAIMCVVNLTLIIDGMTGTSYVLTAA